MTKPTVSCSEKERGDTLVEVTLALAILSLILTGAFAAANKAFLLGQNAKERSQIAGEAQQQAEALQSFRDSHSWSEFVNGNSGTGMPGVRVAATSGCDCFHMELWPAAPPQQWVPRPGPGTDSGVLGGQGSIRITATPVPGVGPPPNTYDFVIHYGVPARGGGADLASDIRLKLVNLDALR